MTQLSPPRPQACTVVVTMHSLLRQQPLQFVGPHGVWQRPAMHCRFWLVQSEHVPPSNPQAFVTLPARQTPFWQQPRQLAQVAPASTTWPGSATQAPLLQISVDVHVAHAAPLRPQPVVEHWPFESQHPLGQFDGPHVEVLPHAKPMTVSATVTTRTATRRGIGRMNPVCLPP